MRTQRHNTTRIATMVLVLTVALGAAACGGASALSAATTPSSKGTPASHGRPLSAPRTTPIQDAKYLEDVAKADPDLASYVQKRGNTALKAMLTDGSAFCAFLSRGGGIDSALLDVAVGAKSVESRTHLPASVTTFNTIESVALLTLCPSEERLVPTSVQAKLRKLGAALGSSPG